MADSTTWDAGTMRVLVAAHGWEALGGGGAERSATALTSALRRRPEITVELAAAVAPGVTKTKSPLGWDEPSQTHLVTSRTDWAFFSWLDPGFGRNWTRLLEATQPQVVHLHHLAHIGAELPQLIKRQFPDTRIVLTLHEFLTICPRSGQMVQSSGELCDAPGTRKCASCMGWDIAYVAARRHYIGQSLKHIDALTSPSAFLARRIRDAAISNLPIHVMPNVVDTLPTATPRTLTDDSAVLKVGYLGQHTPTKGIEVLFDAIELLPKARTRHLDFRIYGGGSDRFGEVFHNKITTHGVLQRKNVNLMGPYSPSRLPDILAGLDVIVVPSTWWENSPVVIEEALSAGVPVICSDIGGMAEKVRDGIDGWHFRAGDTRQLAETLVALNRVAVQERGSAIRDPIEADRAVALYLHLYERMMTTSSNGSASGHG